MLRWGVGSNLLKKLERERGFEPPTLALARRCSTTELFPLFGEDFIDSSGHPIACQARFL